MDISFSNGSNGSNDDNNGSGNNIINNESKNKILNENNNNSENVKHSSHNSNNNYCDLIDSDDNVSINSIAYDENDLYIRKAINEIRRITKQIQNIERNIKHFHGTVNDQEYTLIEDALIKLNTNLDAIESNGNDAIKGERKSAVLFVEHCLNLLDSKLKNNS